MNASRATAQTQRGAALLITLGVLVMASVMGVALLEGVQRAINRSEAVAHRLWVYELNQGMSLWAEDQLTTWLMQDELLTDFSPLGEWSPPFEVEGGWVQGRVVDLGGRFNLNALTNPEMQERRLAQQVFRRLTTQLNLNPTFVADILTRLTPSPSARSIAMATPSRAVGVGTPLLELSELRALPSFNERDYQQLMPWVSALPTPQWRININVTSATVLAALVETLDPAQAERLIQSGPFESMASVWAQPVMQATQVSSAEAGQLVVRSDWFLAQARVRLNTAGHPATYDAYRLISTAPSGYDFRYVSQGAPPF